MEIYVIQPGDSLFRIASRYGVTLRRLLDLNQFPNPRQLVVGQAILVPAPLAAPLQYRIGPGESLYQVANLFGVAANDIAAVNRLSNPSQIESGAVITIPGWTQSDYQVRPGDTLYQLAVRFRTTAAIIARLNQIPTWGPLYPGQTLLLPRPFPYKPAIEVMSYFQVRQLEGLARTVAAYGSLFTYGNIFHFPVGADGVISTPVAAGAPAQADASRATANLADLMKRNQVQPIMVITNWGPNGFDSELARTIMSNQIVKNRTIQNVGTLLSQDGFYGVNVDFENMYPADRPLYTRFIRDLAAFLKPLGYPVTLAVAPKFADLPDQPWVGAFDYAALGQVADAIYIMTYEWGWSGGPPMAVAPINQVRRVLRYAAGLIPPAKILQGIPLYGYDWTLPYTPGKWATAVNLVDVYALAYRNHTVIQYDPTAQSPFFRYRDQRGVDHEVWFEDVRSVQAKYQLAQGLGLRGVGYWSFLNEPYGFPQNWAILGDMFRIVKK